MKSPLTTILRKQTPISKRRPETESNWRSIPYMTAEKSKFTYMKRPRQLSLTHTNMIIGVPSSNKKQILQTDETPTTIIIDTHQYDYRRSIFQ